MAIFQEMKQVRNLAPVPLCVRYDGQEIAVPPGVFQLPVQAVRYAMNQNPIMGMADADNPNISGGKYLIVPVGTKYDRDPLTKDEWETHLDKPCRTNVDEFFADKLGPRERLVIRGRGKPTHAKSSYDTGVRINAGADFTGDREK